MRVRLLHPLAPRRPNSLARYSAQSSSHKSMINSRSSSRSIKPESNLANTLLCLSSRRFSRNTESASRSFDIGPTCSQTISFQQAKASSLSSGVSDLSSEPWGHSRWSICSTLSQAAESSGEALDRLHVSSSAARPEGQVGAAAARPPTVSRTKTTVATRAQFDARVRSGGSAISGRVLFDMSDPPGDQTSRLAWRTQADSLLAGRSARVSPSSFRNHAFRAAACSGR